MKGAVTLVAEFPFTSNGGVWAKSRAGSLSRRNGKALTSHFDRAAKQEVALEASVEAVLGVSGREAAVRVSAARGTVDPDWVAEDLP